MKPSCTIENDWDNAFKKAEDPNMLVKGNPFTNVSTPREGIQERVQDKNMDRLLADKKITKSIHGTVYSAIMNNRIGG